MKKNSNSEHNKSFFMWAITGIIGIIFIMLFVNGYLIYQQTGMDDEDVALFQENN